MEANGIFNETFAVLEKSLDLRSLKHRLSVSNIANMDTPNYKAFDLIVKEEMAKATGGAKSVDLRKTHSRHLPLREIGSNEIGFGSSRNSHSENKGRGKPVDIDREMANLAENSLMYNATAQIFSNKIQGLKNVIQGDKR